MIERLRVPAATVGLTLTAALGGCGFGSESRSKGISTEVPTTDNATQAPRMQITDGQHCTYAERASIVGETAEGPLVTVDSSCTDPGNPYTGVYSMKDEASQREGTPVGNLRNGSMVVMLCRTEGQHIQNDKGVGSTGWNGIKIQKGAELILSNGQTTSAKGGEEVYIPNVHLGFVKDDTLKKC